MARCHVSAGGSPNWHQHFTCCPHAISKNQHIHHCNSKLYSEADNTIPNLNNAITTAVTPLEEQDSLPARLSPILTEFTLLLDLPAELRIAIWQMALRIRTRPEALEVVFNPNTRRYRAMTTIPTLVHTCHEAREEALKTYSLLELRMGVSHGAEYQLQGVSNGWPFFRQMEAHPSNDSPSAVPSNAKLFLTYIDYSSEILFLAKHLSSREGHWPTHAVDFLTQLNLHPEASAHLQSLAVVNLGTFPNPHLVVYISRMKGLRRLLIDCSPHHKPPYGRFSPWTLPWDAPITHIAPRARIIDTPGETRLEKQMRNRYSARVWDGQKVRLESQLHLTVVPDLSERLSSTQSRTELSAEELEALGYRTDWSGVEVEVVETRRAVKE